MLDLQLSFPCQLGVAGSTSDDLTFFFAKMVACKVTNSMFTLWWNKAVCEPRHTSMMLLIQPCHSLSASSCGCLSQLLTSLIGDKHQAMPSMYQDISVIEDETFASGIDSGDCILSYRSCLRTKNRALLLVDIACRRTPVLADA